MSSSLAAKNPWTRTKRKMLRPVEIDEEINATCARLINGIINFMGGYDGNC